MEKHLLLPKKNQDNVEVIAYLLGRGITGIMSNEDDIARINRIISPLVKNGQSLHQIYLDHVDELMCSEKILYNYVDAQLFDIRNIV